MESEANDSSDEKTKKPMTAAERQCERMQSGAPFQRVQVIDGPYRKSKVFAL
jgi:hypothetical protein